MKIPPYESTPSAERVRAPRPEAMGPDTGVRVKASSVAVDPPRPDVRLSDAGTPAELSDKGRIVRLIA